MCFYYGCAEANIEASDVQNVSIISNGRMKNLACLVGNTINGQKEMTDDKLKELIEGLVDPHLLDDLIEGDERDLNLFEQKEKDEVEEA